MIPTVVAPDYRGGGLLNLIASCANARGGVVSHPTLSALPPAELACARNVVLILIDGLGYNYLVTRGQGSAIAARIAGRMTSVFPSTTASAITTTFTGLTPAEHGLTGWFTWFPEADTIAAPLPFIPRSGSDSLQQRGVDARMLFRGSPLFDTLDCTSIVVSHRQIVDSQYNRHFCGEAARFAYDDLAGFVTQTLAAVKSGNQRKFVYAYYPDFDFVSHRFGVGSAEAAAVFASIDAAYEQLLAQLSGTDSALILTSDHGFADCPAENALDMNDRPDLVAMLERPLTGERRVAFCHVRHEYRSEFATRASEWLEGKADVISGSELLRTGWFGGGCAHPQLPARVGDFALIMREHHTVKDWLPCEPRHLHIGNHGGLTADEMFTPLVYARI